LETVVATNDKKRFAFNDDHSRIRASQGHSITVDLALEPQVPPEFLLHGTVAEAISEIQKSGLLKMSRQYVHLSEDEETAKKVGGRRGKPILLQIKASEMYEKGYPFFLSANGVWLTHEVPPAFIIFPS
ncbi:MAG: RNA 2'-phosphotransferase, partial [Chitinophagaceae bacterium]